MTKYGTTAAEQHEGESLDERLRQEIPDAYQDPGEYSGPGRNCLIPKRAPPARAG